MDKSAAEEFDKAKQRLQSNWQVKNTLAVLRAMQETMTELQGQGFAMSLDVRLTGIDYSPYVKGELKIDDFTMDFLLTRGSSSYYTELQLTKEGNTLSTVKAHLGGADSIREFKQDLRTALYTVRALSEMYSEFTVNPGVSRLQSVKPSAPKLRA